MKSEVGTPQVGGSGNKHCCQLQCSPQSLLVHQAKTGGQSCKLMSHSFMAEFHSGPESECERCLTMPNTMEKKIGLCGVILACLLQSLKAALFFCSTSKAVGSTSFSHVVACLDNKICRFICISRGMARQGTQYFECETNYYITLRKLFSGFHHLPVKAVSDVLFTGKCPFIFAHCFLTSDITFMPATQLPNLCIGMGFDITICLSNTA